MALKLPAVRFGLAEMVACTVLRDDVPVLDGTYGSASGQVILRQDQGERCAVTANYGSDAAGEVHWVVVEETDEALEADKAQVATSAGWAASERPFDEIAWWSRQLGRPLSTDGRAEEVERTWWSKQLGHPLGAD